MIEVHFTLREEFHFILLNSVIDANICGWDANGKVKIMREDKQEAMKGIGWGWEIGERGFSRIKFNQPFQISMIKEREMNYLFCET